MTSLNPHETRNRADKVTKLMRAITLLCVRRGAPVRAAEMLRWDPTHWALLALAADCNAPTADTQAIVISLVAARDAAVESGRAR